MIWTKTMVGFRVMGRWFVMAFAVGKTGDLLTAQGLAQLGCKQMVAGTDR